MPKTQGHSRPVARVGRARRAAMRVPEEWSSQAARLGQNPAYRPSGSLSPRPSFVNKPARNTNRKGTHRTQLRVASRCAEYLPEGDEIRTFPLTTIILHDIPCRPKG